MADTAKKPFVKRFLSQLLLLFLVITFGVWGIGDILRGNASNYVAKVGDRLISVHDLQNEISRVQQEASGQMPAELLASPLFRLQVRNKLIQDTLIEEAANHVGFVIGAETAAHEIKRDPFFQDLRGNFDQTRFQAFLRNQRISEGVLMEDIARRLRASALVQSFQLDQVESFPALAALTDFSDGETRDIRIIHVTERNIPAIAAPDDATLEAAYDAFDPTHPDITFDIDAAQFSAPETRDIRLVIIDDTAITHVAKENSKTEKLGTPEENSADLQQAKTALIQTINNQLDDALAEGKPIGEAIMELPVKANVQTYNKLTKDSKALSDKALQIAFSLDELQSSTLDSNKDGSLFLVYVEHITPYTPKRPFKEVKKLFKTAYLEAKKAEAMRALLYKAYAAYTAAKTDEEKRNVLKTYHLSSNTLTDFGKKDYARSGLLLPTYQRLFEVKPGEVILPDSYAAISGNARQKFSFAHVLANHAPDKTNNISVSDAAKAKTMNFMQSYISSALLSDFEQEVPVSLYDLPGNNAENAGQ